LLGDIVDLFFVGPREADAHGAPPQARSYLAGELSQCALIGGFPLGFTFGSSPGAEVAELQPTDCVYRGLRIWAGAVY
jgi:hypothetical protein